MDCPRCERTFLNESYHHKEECDREQIPLTDEEFKDVVVRLFDFGLGQCNYGKRINDGLRKMQSIILESLK